MTTWRCTRRSSATMRSPCRGSRGSPTRAGRCIHAATASIWSSGANARQRDVGTHTQSLVDRDTVTPEEAERLGECIVAWLVEQEIIEPRLTDCCLVDPGYPPGRHYMRACGGIDESTRADDHAGFSRYST